MYRRRCSTWWRIGSYIQTYYYHILFNFTRNIINMIVSCVGFFWRRKILCKGWFASLYLSDTSLCQCGVWTVPWNSHCVHPCHSISRGLWPPSLCSYVFPRISIPNVQIWTCFCFLCISLYLHPLCRFKYRDAFAKWFSSRDTTCRVWNSKARNRCGFL